MHLLPNRRIDMLLIVLVAASVGWLGFVAGQRPTPVQAQDGLIAHSDAASNEAAAMPGAPADSTDATGGVVDGHGHPIYPPPCYPAPCAYPCYPWPCVIFPYPVRCYDPNFPPLPPPGPPVPPPGATAAAATPVPPGTSVPPTPFPVPSPTPGGMAATLTYRVCPQVTKRIPQYIQDLATTEPWRYYGFGERRNPSVPYHPLWNTYRTWLSLRDTGQPYSACNLPMWKSGCP